VATPSQKLLSALLALRFVASLARRVARLISVAATVAWTEARISRRASRSGHQGPGKRCQCDLPLHKPSPPSHSIGRSCDRVRHRPWRSAWVAGSPATRGAPLARASAVARRDMTGLSPQVRFESITSRCDTGRTCPRAVVTPSEVRRFQAEPLKPRATAIEIQSHRNRLDALEKFYLVPPVSNIRGAFTSGPRR
jgi:hypothetical protein